MFEANVVHVIRPTYLLSYSMKVLGEPRTHTYALPDFPLYKKDKKSDRELVCHLWKMMDEADVIIGHNGDAFDLKKANSRFLTHGLTPPAPYKSIDTLKLARRNFKFDSNKLDNLGKYLGVGKKLPHTGINLWLGCMAGDMKSWAVMKRYNAQDVLLLEKVYLKIRPWGTHPDLRHYTKLEGCPACQSTNVIRRGFNHRKKDRPRFNCRDCGKWFQ